MTAAASPAAYTSARFASLEVAVAGVAIAVLVGGLLVLVGLPLWALLSKSLYVRGDFVGLQNCIAYVTTPSLSRSVGNSLAVAAATTAIVVPIAFAYAYALTRSAMPAKGFFYATALVPLFAPSLLPAISLVYFFGNQGFLKSWMLGGSIYGPAGIIMAEVFYCFPHALTILVAALRLADARLYEAAEALGASRGRIFLTVTLGSTKYGVISAMMVVFTLVITDFGIPKVIGGQFSVLATDVYKQVMGQQNFEMGAVVGVMLLIPAVIAFLVDRIAQRRQVALVSARAVAYVPKPSHWRDRAALALCIVVTTIFLAVLGMAVWASFVTYWPYNLDLTLRHYAFESVDSSGWQPFINSLEMAALTALFGTVLIFLGAYLVEKIRAFRMLRLLAQFLAMLPMAVPGLVLGLGYIFFFNAPWNPMNVLYGTIAILVLNCTAHFYTVPHITATTALKQLDPEFEAVSASLKVPFWRTLMRVTVPISMPAILDIAVYLFVSAMTTVSAVVFLYSSDTKLASIAAVNMDEAGFTASAAGMCVLIVLSAMAAKLLQVAVNRSLLRHL
ncbi:MAG: phosphonate ABC transporter permease [Kaistia sp. SCN 65-12]|nr:MAG: phosphonate ABC transporter permease [Kaistia sp. SCN 65-12]